MEKEIPVAVREKDQRKRKEVPKKETDWHKSNAWSYCSSIIQQKQHNGVEVIEID